MKKESPEGCLTPALIFIIWVTLAILLFSCAAPKMEVKQYKVIVVEDGFFAANRGKEVLLFGTQDSVFVGKIINVSIGRK